MPSQSQMHLSLLHVASMLPSELQETAFTSFWCPSNAAVATKLCEAPGTSDSGCQQSVVLSKDAEAKAFGTLGFQAVLRMVRPWASLIRAFSPHVLSSSLLHTRIDLSPPQEDSIEPSADHATCHTRSV